MSFSCKKLDLFWGLCQVLGPIISIFLVQVDLFFYREPEEAKQQEEEEAPVAQDFAISDFNAAGVGSFPADGQWPAATVEQPWTEAAPLPIPAVPSNWAAPETGKILNPSLMTLG